MTAEHKKEISDLADVISDITGDLEEIEIEDDSESADKENLRKAIACLNNAVKHLSKIVKPQNR
jgi:peptidoglycan hydrolase CwlO-like protein